jgi:hypothetical protein
LRKSEIEEDGGAEMFEHACRHDHWASRYSPAKPPLWEDADGPFARERRVDEHGLFSPGRWGRTMTEVFFGQRSPNQREARRLARQSRHLPFASIVVGGFVLINLLSAISSILALGPANGMP